MWNFEKKMPIEEKDLFGLGIGILVGGVLLAGKWVFTRALPAAVRRITSAMIPPPLYISRACSVICSIIPLLTLNLASSSWWSYYVDSGTCIIAADTFAFIGGEAFGWTPLTAVSPKKTWEGALVGLGGCIATSVLLSKVMSWPTSTLSDLIESMIKRDAGVKDSGSLIPGHGGILDRADSYIFTGAMAYSFVKTYLPLYGV